MQWSADRNAGFSRANPQQLYLPLISDFEYHHQAVHVEAQQQNPHSLLNWMRRLLNLRQRYPAFGRGSVRFLEPSNQKVLAFLREHEGEHLLVVANLSRFLQHVALELPEFVGCSPVELFGQTPFPCIADEPYILTLAPHSFHWFALQPAPAETIDPAAAAEPAPPPLLAVAGPWMDLLRGAGRRRLEAALPAYLRAQYWFARKDRPILSARVVEDVPLPGCPDEAHIVLVEVEPAEGDPEQYQLPLAFAAGAGPNLPAERVRAGEGDSQVDGVLYDALAEPEIARALFHLIAEGCNLPGRAGTVTASLDPAVQQRWHETAKEQMEIRAEPGRQDNTVLHFGAFAILKLYRQVDDGPHPEIELGAHLTRRGFAHIPPVLGTLAYARSHGAPMVLGTLQGMVRSDGSLWELALEQLGVFLDRAASEPPMLGGLRAANLLADAGLEPPAQAQALLDPMLGLTRLLGRRTAELHGTLADPDDPAFAPEPFTPLYQRSLYQSLRGLTGRVLRTLRASLPSLDAAVQAEAVQILQEEQAILARFAGVLKERLRAERIRCHGDLHLGHVLRAGNDLMFIDFEGEPATPMAERQLKHCPLWDIAGIVQSLAYTVELGLAERQGESARLRAWGTAWQRWLSASFVRAYVDSGGLGSHLPDSHSALETLLDVFMLHKAIYALGYELNYRPAWVPIALRSLRPLIVAAQEPL